MYIYITGNNMYHKEIVLCADNYGYRCFMDKTHPLSHITGRVYLHRHIALLAAGRWLTKEDIVHHIDGNKLNNSADNLYLCLVKEHAEIHNGVLYDLICPVCDTLFAPQNSYLIFCLVLCKAATTIKRPDITKELLDSLIPKHSWVVLGSMFGYSDTGIKKRAKALGCTIPVRKKT